METILINIEELIDDLERDENLTRTEITEALYKIKEEIEKDNLRKKFNKQLKKMELQEKHNHKTVCETWEYALKRIKE